MKTITSFKSTFYIIALLCNTELVSGQDLENLDRRFGINKFKLESEVSLYKGNLEFQFRNRKVDYYHYKGDDLLSLFEVPFHTCALGFYKNKLYSITFQFGDLNVRDQDLIQYRLRGLFGLPNLGVGQLPIKHLWHYLWQTSKTYLAFTKYSYNSEYLPGEVSVYMFSEKMDNIINNDNF